MKLNINGNRIPYEPDFVWNYLYNIRRSIRPCLIFDYLSTCMSLMDMTEINTELSELVSVEVWL